MGRTGSGVQGGALPKAGSLSGAGRAGRLGVAGRAGRLSIAGKMPVAAHSPGSAAVTTVNADSLGRTSGTGTRLGTLETPATVDWQPSSCERAQSWQPSCERALDWQPS